MGVGSLLNATFLDVLDDAALHRAVHETRDAEGPRRKWGVTLSAMCRDELSKRR